MHGGVYTQCAIDLSDQLKKDFFFKHGSVHNDNNNFLYGILSHI